MNMEEKKKKETLIWHEACRLPQKRIGLALWCYLHTLAITWVQGYGVLWPIWILGLPLFNGIRAPLINNHTRITRNGEGECPERKGSRQTNLKIHIF